MKQTAKLAATSSIVALLILVAFSAQAATGLSEADETQEVASTQSEEEPTQESEAEGERAEREGLPEVYGQITVSAQKREEPLQKVPMAITAFGSNALEEKRIDTIDEVYARTPGFSFGQFNAVQPQPYIRGIGSTDDSASGDNSVVIFVDEVYVGRAGAFDIDLYDLERVEVLRGPQGTLWGKNVIGGAVNLVTKKPSREMNAIVQATAGNYSRAELFATVGGPLSEDRVAGKISASKRDRDGYTLHQLTGNRLLDEDSLAVRGHLDFTPSDNVRVLLSADYQEDDLAGNAREPRGEPFRFFPWFPPAVSSPDPYVAELNTDGFQDREVMGGSVRFDVQTGFGTLTSISAYRTSDFQFQEDFDATERGLIVDNVDEDAKQITQEFRLASNGGERWLWVTGLYYLKEDIDRLDFNDFSGNDAGIAAFFRPPVLLPSFKVFYNQENTTESYALFGQAKLAVNERVNLTFGGRYTSEEKDATIEGSGFDPVGAFLQAPYRVDVTESWDDISPQIAVDVELKDGVLFYATASRGFKSGGFNGSANSGASARTPFDPEEATNLELGLKSQTKDNRLLFNVAAFYIDYSDLQVFQLIEGARLVIDNAAEATSQGVELELAARPTQGLDISAGFAYLDAEYDRFIDEQGNDFSGNSLTRAPENSGHLAIDYAWPVGERGVVTLGGEYAYQSEIFFNPDNFVLVGDDGHSVVNARIAYETADGHWRFTLWGKNVGDELHYIHGIDGRGPFNLSQNAAMVVGAPDTYGLSVAWRTR